MRGLTGLTLGRL